MEPTVSVEKWHKRILASRERRGPREAIWMRNAQILTNAYIAIKEGNEDELVTLPSGDQVKVGLVFRNIEQTMALLDIPEIGVTVTATDFVRELNSVDSHREQVVQQGIWQSMMFSGLVREEEASDKVKWDGSICGHGVTYSFWRIFTEQQEIEQVQLVDEVDGVFVPVVDEFGVPAFEPVFEDVVVSEGVKDLRVSPLYFLADANAGCFYESRWHGHEAIMSLDELRADPELDVPEDAKGSAFEYKTLYGDEKLDCSEDSVKVIFVYDRDNHELIRFLEVSGAEIDRTRKRGKKKTTVADKKPTTLYVLSVTKRPLPSVNPDFTPYNFYVPQPANDTPFGIDQLEHIRNQAVEADKLRTRAANLTRQLKLLLLYKKGKLDQDELDQAWNNPRGGPVGVTVQEGERMEDLLREVKLGSIPKEIYDQVRMAEDDVRKTSGVSETPFGGAETATESENQMSVGGARPRRKSRKFLKFLSEVAETHREYLRNFAPEGQSMPVQTLWGEVVNFPFGREAFEGRFIIDVRAGGGALAQSPVQQKMFIEFADRAMGKAGPFVDLLLFREALDRFDIRDKQAFMRAAQMGMSMMSGGQVPGQGPVIPPAANLNDVSNGQTIRSAINSVAESRG